MVKFNSVLIYLFLECSVQVVLNTEKSTALIGAFDVIKTLPVNDSPDGTSNEAAQIALQCFK